MRRPTHQRRAYALPPTPNGVATPIASYGFTSGTPTDNNVKVNQHDDSVWVFPAVIYAGGTTTPPSPTANPVGGGVVQFPAGSATPSRAFYGSSSFPDAPVLQINSAAFDDYGNAYVAYIVQHPIANPCSYGRISAFGPSQNGDVTPWQNYVDQGDPYDITIPVKTGPTNSGFPWNAEHRGQRESGFALVSSDRPAVRAAGNRQRRQLFRELQRVQRQHGDRQRYPRFEPRRLHDNAGRRRIDDRQFRRRKRKIHDGRRHRDDQRTPPPRQAPIATRCAQLLKRRRR